MEPPRITPGASSPWGGGSAEWPSYIVVVVVRSAAGAIHMAAAGSAGRRCDRARRPAGAMGWHEPRCTTGASRSRGRLIWSEHAGAKVRLAAPCV